MAKRILAASQPMLADFGVQDVVNRTAMQGITVAAARSGPSIKQGFKKRSNDTRAENIAKTGRKSNQSIDIKIARLTF